MPIAKIRITIPIIGTPKRETLMDMDATHPNDLAEIILLQTADRVYVFKDENINRQKIK
jgi:hypothetical protein